VTDYDTSSSFSISPSNDQVLIGSNKEKLLRCATVCDSNQDIYNRSEHVIEWLISLLEKGHPLSISYSAGKDSSAVVVLALEAIRRCVERGDNIPQCYITHSNTLIENPAMGVYADSMLESLCKFSKKNKLPVEVIKVTPSMSSSFVYATIGRGKLPRFVNSAHRECSIDLKVRPQQKALKRVLKNASHNSSRPVVVLTGLRYSESNSRQLKMIDRGDGPRNLVAQENGSFSNTIIAEWDLTDVWELLMACDKKRGGIYETFVDDFEWTLKLYKDANEGSCVIITGDDGNKKSCGSRFGCAFCTVSGERDKSMEAMIDSDTEYSYLEGVNKFRNLLIKTQYDLDKRDWLGRSLSPAGYVRVRPDNYSSEFRRQLLRYLMTLDVLEQERAENHFEDLVSGAIEDTPKNRCLAEVKFQFITPDLILAVDLAWSVQRDFYHAFPALREWHEIYDQGRRYRIPDLEHHEKVPIPEARWFHVGTFDHKWGVDGLRDIYGEAVNPIRKPNNVPYMACKDPLSGRMRRIVTHETADELYIDPVEANIFVTCEFEGMYFDSLNRPASEGLIYLLDRGLIKLGKGQAAKYDLMARRGQYYNRLKESLSLSYLRKHMVENSISDESHKSLLVESKIENQEDQILLFA